MKKTTRRTLRAAILILVAVAISPISFPGWRKTTTIELRPSPPPLTRQVQVTPDSTITTARLNGGLGMSYVVEQAVSANRPPP